MDMNTIALIKGLAGNSGGSSLPTDPAQDGTYILQNTVSSGTGTLSWASGGSSGGVLVVHGTTDLEGVTTLDKTWQEIVDAGFSVIPVYDSETGTTLIKSIAGYMVDREIPDTPLYLLNYGAGLNFYASSANDYPNDVEPE